MFNLKKKKKEKEKKIKIKKKNIIALLGFVICLIKIKKKRKN